MASKNETCQNSFENVHNFAHVCRSKLHLNPNDLAGRVSLKKRINYVTFIGRCRTHPTSGVSSIKLSFCLEHTCHWASLVSGHQETWISPKKVSLYGRPLWMHTGNNSHGGKWDSKKSFAATQVVLQPPIEKGQVWGIREKENKPKAAAKARHVSAEELPRRRTSLAECRRSRDAQDVTLEPSDAGRVIIGNVAERNQTTTTVPAISLDWLPYTTTYDGDVVEMRFRNPPCYNTATVQRRPPHKTRWRKVMKLKCPRTQR